MRRAAIFLGFLLGCGATTPPSSSSPTPAPTTPAAGSSAPAASPAESAAGATPGGPAASAAASAAPASSAHKTDVLLDTKLPPKVVSAGGSYSIGVNDPKGFSKTEVVGFVEKSSKAVDACFGEIFKAGGKKGKLSFAVVIDGNGKLKSAKPQEDELKDKKLPGCIDKVLKKVEWGKPSEKTGASFVVEWVIQSLTRCA